jgi:exonuclease III
MINESSCDIVCLQETKRATFDLPYIKNFCPPAFDSFEYIPSASVSRGTIIIWKSSRFMGQVEFRNDYAMTMEFTSTTSGATWMLTNIYAPYDLAGREEFLT